MHPVKYIVNTHDVGNKMKKDGVFNVLRQSVADPERFDADPDPTFHADADPDPKFV